MRKSLSFLCLLLAYTIGTAFGQKINYQPSFGIALREAESQNKMILVVISATIPQTMLDSANFTKRVSYKTGLEDKQVAKYINDNFIAYSVYYKDPNAADFRKKYNISRFPVYLFIDKANNPVYVEDTNSPSAAKYLTMFQKAQDVLASGKTVTQYQARYLAGERTLDFLKAYIELNQRNGIYDNAKLANDYADQLPANAFQDYKQVLFVMQAGPYAYGYAYKLCAANKKMMDSLYKYEPAALRKSINDRIIDNTYAEAIKRRDFAMAKQATDYLLNTWRGNPRQGMVAGFTRMLVYLDKAHDTTNYYKIATHLYDEYYLNISADSARKKDTEARIKARQSPGAQTDDAWISSHQNGKRDSTFSPIIIPGISNSIANDLNSGAQQFYDLGTKNRDYLSKAITWSKRAIELDPKQYAYYDTLAHLLYRTGAYNEATIAQESALKLVNADEKDKGTIERIRLELTKIKSRSL